MRRKHALILLMAAIASLAIIAWFALDLTSPAYAAQVIPPLASTASPLAATPTPAATAQASSSSSSSLDPAVVAALIGIVVAFVAGGLLSFRPSIQRKYSGRALPCNSAMTRRWSAYVE